MNDNSWYWGLTMCQAPFQHNLAHDTQFILTIDLLFPFYRWWYWHIKGPMKSPKVTLTVTTTVDVRFKYLIPKVCLMAQPTLLTIAWLCCPWNGVSQSRWCESANICLCDSHSQSYDWSSLHEWLTHSVKVWKIVQTSYKAKGPCLYWDISLLVLERFKCFFL